VKAPLGALGSAQATAVKTRLYHPGYRTYIIQRYRVSAQRSSFYAALPLAIGAASNVIDGALSDWLVRRTGSLLWGRRLVGLGGYLMAAVGFAAAAAMQKPFAAILCLMLAEFG
jgi:MFS transporter, ACS family, glucarate transporter